jgi:hypothetical protein
MSPIPSPIGTPLPPPGALSPRPSADFLGCKYIPIEGLSAASTADSFPVPEVVFASSPMLVATR